MRVVDPLLVQLAGAFAVIVALEGGMFWGAFTFVGADLHHRFGLGFAAVGLAVAAFGGGGFLYVMVAPQLVRLLGARGLCQWGGIGLGLAFAGMALFALCLFIGQAIGVPLAAPVVDRWGATPVFWTAAIVLPALALWFAQAIRRRQLAAELRV